MVQQRSSPELQLPGRLPGKFLEGGVKLQPDFWLTGQVQTRECDYGVKMLTSTSLAVP